MAPSEWSKDNVAVVTGANRGIGFEIVRLLAEQGLTVVLTARDDAKGKAAADELQAKGLKTVVFHQLDPTDAKSVESLAAWLKSEFGTIDILINNAGAMSTIFSYDAAKTTLDVNYYGVKRVDASLIPLLKSKNGARIVNVSSRAGLYERLRSESLKDKFRDEESYSEQLADALATKYLADVKAGRVDEEGWLPAKDGGNSAYSESKIFLNVYASSLAKALVSRTDGNEIFVAGMCPGATATDMFNKAVNQGFSIPEGYPIKTPAEGAETAVWLALLPKAEWQGKTGRLFGENTEYPFGWKNPPF